MKTVYNIYFALLLVILLAFGSKTEGRQVIAKQNGNWKTTNTWLNGYIPTNGDTITIPASFKVVVTTQEDYSGSSVNMRLYIYGELNFQTGKKLTFPSGTIIEVFSGGSVTPGSGGGMSNYIQIGTQVVWNAAAGPANGYLMWPSSPLPVELIKFNAEILNEKYISLAWTTATEVNNDMFFVERSTSSNRFESIAIIDGHGTSSVGHNYSYIDTPPKNGIYYYRLKQIDFDGKYAYSKIIPVKFISENKLKVSVYPNPTKGDIFVSIENLENNYSYRLMMYDATGNKLIEKNDEIIPGSKGIKVSDQSRNFSPGIYTILLLMNEEIFKRQVIIR